MVSGTIRNEQIMLTPLRANMETIFFFALTERPLPLLINPSILFANDIYSNNGVVMIKFYVSLKQPEIESLLVWDKIVCR